MLHAKKYPIANILQSFPKTYFLSRIF